MKYNTYTLPNGLRIIHLPSDSMVVYCGYEIGVGARDEQADEEGLAHFCEHTSFKGTSKRSSLQIINYLDSVGGDVNAFTNKEDTVYYAAVLKEHTDMAIDLLTDIVFHSVYPQNELNKEIEVIGDEIESYNDSPSDLIFDEFENLIFANHPLGHNILGNSELLHKYTTADTIRFTKRYYNPSNAIFFAYGNIDFNVLVKELKKATYDLKSTKVSTKKPAVTLPKYVPQEITRAIETHQAHVMIGNRAYGIEDNRRIALYLLNNILGGPGMSNRLNLSLRERNGLVYTVDSTMVSYGDTGLWCIYFGCDAHDIGRCRKLIDKELKRFMDKPLSEAQLKAAKKQIKGQIGVACDSRENFALDFGKAFLHYGIEKDIETLYSRIEAVTATQIQTVAQEIFAQDQLTTLIFK